MMIILYTNSKIFGNLFRQYSMRCKNGTRKKKGECKPYPFTTRCKKGTRKNKAGECKSYVMLSKEDMDSIIQEYQLNPEAAR